MICNAPDTTFHICNSNSCLFRRCDMIFPSWLGFCLLFCILFMSCISSHVIIRIASALVIVFVFKTGIRSYLSRPPAFVDRSKTNLVLRFPSCLNWSLFAQCIDPSPVSETSLNPNRTIVTIGSGSSPNIYKTSPFSSLDFLNYIFSAVRF